MIRRSTISAAGGAAAVMCLGGCGDVTVIHIDSYMFHVPKENMSRETIPWLPASQLDGLRFIINPEARSQEQIMVVIESTAGICRPASAPSHNMLSLACTQATRNDKAEIWSVFAPDKVHPRGHSTQWEYRVADVNNDDWTVAACSGPSDSGSCLSIGSYKRLVYSVRFRDSDIQHLPEIRSTVREMLSSWETTSENE